jgi:hypothetical protein
MKNTRVMNGESMGPLCVFYVHFVIFVCFGPIGHLFCILCLSFKFMVCLLSHVCHMCLLYCFLLCFGYLVP